MATRSIYWYDRYQNSILQATLESPANSTVFVANVTARSMAVDQLSGKLYYADSDTGFIKMTDPSTQLTKTLMKPPLSTAADSRINGIAHDAVNGFVYWTDSNSVLNKGQIWRMRNDGSNKEVVLSRLHWPYGITISYERRSLFFCEARLLEIQEFSWDVLNNNGTIPVAANVYNFRQTSSRNLPFMYSIAVFENMVYFIDGSQQYVERFNLTTGVSSFTQFSSAAFYRPRSLALFSKTYYDQYIGVLQNPCARVPATCSNMCFNVNNSAVCQCPDGTHLRASMCMANTLRTDNAPYVTSPINCPYTSVIQLQPCQNASVFSWTEPNWADDYTATNRLRRTYPNYTSPAIFSPGSYELVFT
uniref:HYR domain-containing protein n=1 Tax=Ciona savignyi TaxID=51511 RepID=H2YY50_CIOSA